MQPANERAEICFQLKDAVRRHAPDGEKYPSSRVDDVLESVIGAGHDEAVVREQYDRLLRIGELYEINGEIVGVV